MFGFRGRVHVTLDSECNRNTMVIIYHVIMKTIGHSHQLLFKFIDV